MTATKRLDEIEARLSAATPGPWTRTQWEEEQPDVPWDADAEFIAHAREDVPALVAVVRAVEALHRPNEDRGVRDGYCRTCKREWPCPTAAAVQELAA